MDNGRMPVVTICGSLKFPKEMMEEAYRLEFMGYCVITPLISDRKSKEGFTAEELDSLTIAHYRKIDVSDAILVINIGGYIGAATQLEINYARKKGKRVYFLEGADEDKIGV